MRAVSLAAIILLALSALLVCVAVVVIVRILLADTKIPRVRDGDTLPPAPGLLSIVIPAHNEARVIEESVRCLRRQTRRNFEAIYVLDRCTDRTRELLEGAAEGDPRIRVIENHDCPPDWAGKCNACRVGASHASGEWLLFTDADCRLGADMLDAMLAIAANRQTDLLSALGRLTYRHGFERMLQPVAAAVLFRIFPIDKANREERRWPFANGQFLLFRKASYDACGGHELVKDALLEDLAFAWRMHAQGARLGVVDASRRMEVAMYDSARAMRSGWTRIYIESCGRIPRRLAFAALELLFLSLILPLCALAALVLGVVGAFSGSHGSVLLASAGAVGLAAGFAAVALIHQRQRAPLVGAIAHPAAAVIVAWWLVDGARMLVRRVPVRWGGKAYVLEPR
jgi:glycosyltransferase involved in cell wall biosynthesis